jgi:hypothetical protein
MDGVPPRPNLLACTPTLEMGVNIGDLEAVAMRNIPQALRTTLSDPAARAA